MMTSPRPTLRRAVYVGLLLTVAIAAFADAKKKKKSKKEDKDRCRIPAAARMSSRPVACPHQC